MVLKELRSHLSKLQPIAKDLNKASNAFTAELKTLETELAELNIGLEVELDAPFYVEHARHEYDENSQETIGTYVPEYYLVYKKVMGNWRIAVQLINREKGPLHDQRVEIWKRPLIDASRQLRIAAADHIAKLIEKIGAAAKDKLAILNKVSDSVAPQGSDPPKGRIGGR